MPPVYLASQPKIASSLYGYQDTLHGCTQNVSRHLRTRVASLIASLFCNF